MPTSVVITAICLVIVLAVIWIEHRYPEDPQ